MWGPRFRAERVKGLGFRVRCVGLRAWGSGLRAQGQGRHTLRRVLGFGGFRVYGSSKHPARANELPWS